MDERPVTITLDSRRWEYVDRPARPDSTGKGTPGTDKGSKAGTGGEWSPRNGSATPGEGRQKDPGRGKGGPGSGEEAPAPAAEEPGAGDGARKREVQPTPPMRSVPLVALTAATLGVVPP
ncbi:hypothetical protein CALCODRAFT_486325 [Calocera cornea HHB12733]|uniref:Uncharacterized protein n=1 Tax=Calocera cornea HHB12733 TaxID=1353952 RepID=A0A165DT77_9BASI|nr:hypothetical protein CALCODRAFT_486325 [Calocera cornea HHB12733]